MNMVVQRARNCGKTLEVEQMIELAHSLGKNLIIVPKEWPKSTKYWVKADFGYGRN